MSSIIIEYLREKPEAVTLFFYFDFRDTEKQTVNGMIRSLISQLYDAQEDARPPLDAFHSEKGVCTSGNLLATLLKMIHRTVFTVQIVLDALDECGKPQELDELLKYLNRLHGSTGAKFRMILISRREEAIKSSLSRWIADKNRISIEPGLVDKDIRAHVHEELREDRRFRRWRESPDILDLIETKLVQKAGGLFQWATCQLDNLSECIEEEALLKALEEFPEDLCHTYSRILQKIGPRNQKHVTTILQFLTYWSRPLTIEAAVDLIAVDCDQDIAFNPEKRKRIPYPKDILDFCSSLLDVYKGKREYIRLAHSSVREYLVSDAVEPSYKSNMQEVEARSATVTTSLRYLISLGQSIGNRRIYDIADEYLKTVFFQEWPAHARIVGEKDENLCHLLHRVFTSPERRALEYLAKAHVPFKKALSSLQYTEAVPIYLAASAGLTHTVRELAKAGADINAVCKLRLRTALNAAINAGYEDTVDVLIQNGADVSDSRGLEGRSALHLAIGHRSPGIIQRLVDEGCLDRLDDRSYRNHVKHAVSRGDAKSLSIILSESTIRNKTDQANNVWLCAARTPEIAQIFVDRGADVNSSCQPLRNALRVQGTDMLQFLFMKGAVFNGEGTSLLETWCKDWIDKWRRASLVHNKDHVYWRVFRTSTEDMIDKASVLQDHTSVKWLAPDTFWDKMIVAKKLGEAAYMTEATYEQVCRLQEDPTRSFEAETIRKRAYDQTFQSHEDPKTFSDAEPSTKKAK